MLLPDTAYFELTRATSLGSQLFQIYSAHFCHFSVSHFFWDTFAFVLLTAFIEQKERNKILILIALSPSMSLYFWVFSAELYSYRGLSGIDSGLMGILCVVYLKRGGKDAVIGLGLLFLFLLKNGIEMYCSEALFVQEAGFVNMPEMHLLGFLLGLVVGGIGSAQK